MEDLSTHDQVLGGTKGQTFLGCRFPADGAYGPRVANLGERIGKVLAEQGVIGRFGIDFVVVRDGDEWFPYAIEINLRNGGTTHPMLTMQALTDGEFDPHVCQFVTTQGNRFYVATDHLESPTGVSHRIEPFRDLELKSTCCTGTRHGRSRVCGGAMTPGPVGLRLQPEFERPVWCVGGVGPVHG